MWSPSKRPLGRVEEEVHLSPVHPGTVACCLGQGLESKSSPLHILSQACGTDIVNEVMKHLPIIIPDHATTLGEAIEACVSGGTILIKGGEYTVGARPGQEIMPGHADTAETRLHITKEVNLVGDAGAMPLLRGMLVISGAKGSIKGLKLQDAGDCCVKVHSGAWSVERCHLLCGHASAVRAEGRSNVVVTECKLGGEGKIGQAVAEYYDLPRTWIDTMGSVQEYGLRKNACYCLFVRDESSVSAYDCEMSFCSESAVFVRDKGSAALNGCRLVNCDVAFTAGVGGGQSLIAEGCEVRECVRLWYDDDRPAVAVTRDNSVTLFVSEK